MTHKLAQIGMGGLNQQMKVIGHQNVGNKVDTESFTAIGQSIHKSTAVSVSDKDILATGAPVHHMVIGTRIAYINKSLKEFDKELNEAWDVLTAIALDPGSGVSDAALGKLFRKHCQKLAERERLKNNKTL